MSKKSKSKSQDVAAPMDMAPRMHLDGDHAKAMKRHRVGDKVRMEVHGKVMSVNQSQYDGEKPRHSIGIEIERIKHKSPKQKTGHAGGKHADDAEGAKGAMDEALEE